MKIVRTLIVFAISTLLLTGCSSKNKLTGTWVTDKKTDGYPDTMVINKDGTGSADGYNMNWYIGDDHGTPTVVFNLGVFGNLEYFYEVSGSALELNRGGNKNCTYHK